MAQPCNFGVSYSRRTKFGSMGYLDVLSSKIALIGNMEGFVTLSFIKV